MTNKKKFYPNYPEPLRENLLIFKQRIRNNLSSDRGLGFRNRKIKNAKNLETRMRSIENEENCINELWVLDQYKKQKGKCAHPYCNHLLNNFTEKKEPTNCWRSTSVNRIDNTIGHVKDNCNLMHSYCNSSMERPHRGCHLFNCSRKNCKCKSIREKVFEKIEHPENLNENRKRMILIMRMHSKIIMKFSF